MPRKLDDEIGKVLKRHGFGPSAVWDCHGVWVVYHKVLEQIAAKSDIVFDMPVIIEANAEKGIASCTVRGTMGERSEWSIGEASPKNNKNPYCWAMAEKRAKDRVILKLIGLRGFAYSEDEADDFKEDAKRQPPPKQSPHPDKEDLLDWGDLLEDVPAQQMTKQEQRDTYKMLDQIIVMAQTPAELIHFAKENQTLIWSLPDGGRHALREKYETLLEKMEG